METVKEENKLIAEFMGFKRYPIEGKSDGYYVQFKKGSIPSPTCISSLEFQYSWDWLMPVVEKINERDWVTIFSDECKIHSLNVNEFEDIVVINEGTSLIKTVYEAVCKYIEWYNENIK